MFLDIIAVAGVPVNSLDKNAPGRGVFIKARFSRLKGDGSVASGRRGKTVLFPQAVAWFPFPAAADYAFFAEC